MEIVSRGARILQLALSPEAAREVAARSRGTPRIAGRLLRRIRDFAAVAKLQKVEAKHADEALNRLEVDRRGLDNFDRRYLKIIMENYNGGPVGVETLSAALGEPRDALEEIIEPYLLQEGFVQRTPRGRMAAAMAYSHLGLAVPKSVTQQTLFDTPGTSDTDV
jgi:Holliday junction DNA helicase RuvB